MVGGQRPEKQKHACFLPLLTCPASTPQPGPDPGVRHAGAPAGSALNAAAGSPASALASRGVFGYGSLPGKGLLDDFRGTLPSAIRVKRKLAMVGFPANPPLRRGAKHGWRMRREQASTARATHLVEAPCACGVRPQTLSGTSQDTRQLITLGQMLPEITRAY